MDVRSFLQKWHDASPTMEVRTSGSTGTPKTYDVLKERMRASARMTCRYLGLKAGDTALLCMPLQYIAGMMMVVRAEECGLQLLCVPPTSHPMASLDRAPDFAAMVPLQVWETLKDEREAALLRQVRHLLIGGGAISPELEAKLRSFPNAVWSSYGMTETLSHIALRPVSKSIFSLPQNLGDACSDGSLSLPHISGDACSDDEMLWYRPMPGVALSQTETGCLVIDAPAVAEERLVTNDIVELRPDGRFRVVGRLDNVVCTGGIKVQIEEVEQWLQAIDVAGVQVTSAPHPKFGEELVWLSTEAVDLVSLRQRIPNPYWLPKRIIKVSQLPRTATGKPDRAAAKRLAAV